MNSFAVAAPSRGPFAFPLASIAKSCATEAKDDRNVKSIYAHCKFERSHPWSTAIRGMTMGGQKCTGGLIFSWLPRHQGEHHNSILDCGLTHRDRTLLLFVCRRVCLRMFLINKTHISGSNLNPFNAKNVKLHFGCLFTQLG